MIIGGEEDGAGTAVDQLFDGIIDEVRISSMARGADWIKTEYNNESSPGGFYAVGSEEVASSRRRGLTIVGRLIPGGSVESASLGDYQNE